MNKLKLYRIDINYIKFLYRFDKRVQYNEQREDEYTKRRVYLGIVLQVSDYNYFVPLEHPRPAHQNIKNNIFIFKIHKGKYGMLGFNNMIPVTSTNVTLLDLNKQDLKYQKLLNSQLYWLNRNVDLIYMHSKFLYDAYKNKTVPKYIFKRCCNFKLLEEKCLEYNTVKN